MRFRRASAEEEHLPDLRPNHAVWRRLENFLSLKAPKTADTYRGVIREWCRFLRAPFNSENGAQRILDARDLHALAFRKYLSEQPGEKPRSERRESRSREVLIAPQSLRRKKDGLEATQSNATIAKKFAVLRRFYRLLMSFDFEVKANPFDSDRVPPPPKDAGRKRPTEMVEFKLVNKIISLADPSMNKGLRDKAILCVLFGGALRSSEVSALTIGDVRKTVSGTVYLYLRATKARRDAQQALPKWAAQVVEQHLSIRVKEGAKALHPLFVTYTGKAGRAATGTRLPSSGIYRIFKEYCDRAGAGKFLSPHSARATAITRLLAAGIPHREVQEFSRHSSVQMVELYDKRRIGVDENAAKDLDFD